MLESRAVRKTKSYLGSMGGILGALLIILPNSAWANHIPSRVELGRCEKHLKVRLPEVDGLLERYRIGNIYAQYSLERIGIFGGFVLRISKRNSMSTTRTLEVPEELQPWRTAVWSTDGKTYQALSVGFRNLESHSQRLNGAIIENALRYPNDNLRILYSPEFEHSLDSMYTMRWRLHDAVLKKYIDVKKYLSDDDLSLLNRGNEWSDNSEVFALFGGPLKPPEEMSWYDFYDHLAITMEVTYFGKRDFRSPTVRGGLEALGYHSRAPDDKLPFQFRLDPAVAAEFSAKVYARFDPEYTCEAMRFARFDPHLPPQLFNRFLLGMLNTVQARGMKYILASVDDSTLRLFGRYGFKKFLPLPVKQNEKPEYLCYLEVGSPEYMAITKKLKQSVEEVLQNAEDR